MTATASKSERPSASASPVAAAKHASAPADEGTRKNAYLINSPGFVREFIANLVAMGCLAALCVHIQPLYEVGEAVHGFVLEQMMHGAQRMAWWSLLGHRRVVVNHRHWLRQPFQSQTWYRPEMS